MASGKLYDRESSSASVTSGSISSSMRIVDSGLVDELGIAELIPQGSRPPG
jgi:hypothetical protein